MIPRTRARRAGTSWRPSSSPASRPARKSFRAATAWRRPTCATRSIASASQETQGRRMPALSAASGLALAAFGSASLLQGRLAADLPEEIVEAFPEAVTGAQRALQFSRSASGMTASLVGVSSPAHAHDNFALAGVDPADPAKVLALFD